MEEGTQNTFHKKKETRSRWGEISQEVTENEERERNTNSFINGKSNTYKDPSGNNSRSRRSYFGSRAKKMKKKPIFDLEKEKNGNSFPALK